jgi:hypothetical protein
VPRPRCENDRLLFGLRQFCNSTASNYTLALKSIENLPYFKTKVLSRDYNAANSPVTCLLGC